MPRTVTVAGISYTLPTSGDNDWGRNFDTWATAISANAGGPGVLAASIADYGAVSNTTYVAANATANKAAFAAAKAAAITAGHNRILVPGGTYWFDGSAGTGMLYINADMEIVGDGIGLSILRDGPDTLTTDSIGFYVAAGFDLTLKDLTMRGPTALVAAEPSSGSGAHSCIGVYHEGNGEVNCERVEFLRQMTCIFTGATSGASNKGALVSVVDSYFGPRAAGIYMEEGTDANVVGLTARRCTFKYASDAFVAGAGVWGHHNYLHEGVSFDIDGCEYLFAPQYTYGIHSYGGAGTLVARQCRIVNSKFQDHATHVLLNKRQVTEIIGCKFVATQDCTHISVRGRGRVVGSSFLATGTYSAYCFDDSLFPTTSLEIDVIGCSFNPGGSAGYVAHINRTNTSQAIPWRFNSCSFYNVLAAGAVALADNGRLDFDNCTFHTTSAADLMQLRGGKHSLTRCKNFGNKAPLFRSSGAALDLTLVDNQWNIGSANTTIIRDAAFAMTLRSRGDIVNGGAYAVSGTGTLNLADDDSGSNALGTGVTLASAGALRRRIHKINVPAAVWIANSTSQNKVIFTLPAKAKVVGSTVDVTQAYAYNARTFLMKLGTASDDDAYVLSFAGSVQTKGLVDADFGIGLVKSDTDTPTGDTYRAWTGGHTPSWSSTTPIWLTLTISADTLGNGTATNLTGGICDVYLTVEYLP